MSVICLWIPLVYQDGGILNAMCLCYFTYVWRWVSVGRTCVGLCTIAFPLNIESFHPFGGHDIRQA